MSEKRRARLEPILAQLEAAGEGAFLDLCELTLMYAERMPHGMIKWDHPRVLVHIRLKPRKEKTKR